MLNHQSANMHTTAWSVVLGAQRGGEEGRRCMEYLCHTYWKPAYYYARRRGMDHHAASDAVQEFFARMLAGDWIDSVDRERGRFRGWLLTALRRWISRARTPTGMDRKTLVDQEIVHAYESEDAGLGPEELFNRAWARSCLDEALRLLREEEGSAARQRQVTVLMAYLEAAQNESEVSYQDLAERFGVTVTTITNDLHRARALFKTYLIRVIAETVGGEDEIERELYDLRRYLAP